jgi:hypothetical protein
MSNKETYRASTKDSRAINKSFEDTIWVLKTYKAHMFVLCYTVLD